MSRQPSPFLASLFPGLYAIPWAAAFWILAPAAWPAGAAATAGYIGGQLLAGWVRGKSALSAEPIAIPISLISGGGAGLYLWSQGAREELAGLPLAWAVALMGGHFTFTAGIAVLSRREP